MKYSILFTDTAKADLRDIALYIAEQSQSVDIAVRFVNEIQAHCEKLQDFPLMGAFPKDHLLKSLGYRFLVKDDYLICYTVSEEKSSVYIVAIFNAKKDYTRILRNLF